MINLICESCNKKFNSNNSIKKFCSRQCYYDSRKNIPRSEDFKSKIKKALMGQKLSEERKLKIAQSNTLHIPEEIQTIIKNLWQTGYISTRTAINFHLKRLNIDFYLSQRIYARFKKDNKDFFIKYNKIQPAERPFEFWEPEKFLLLIEDLNKYSITELVKKYEIADSSLKLISKKYNIEIPKGFGYYNNLKNGGTLPEKKIESFLQELNFEYIKEYKIGKYIVDFLIKDKIIEVFGDYWHCNPKIFPQPITSAQKKTIERYEKRNKTLSKDYKIIYIWEYDIIHGPDLVKKQLKNFIED